ncbi:HPr family phosphocarrier protein [Brevibacillus ruminantium]|uniref:Phosphocarrier protein HPr n=1 Tax=Brevibacillus ruminantium TaxID=2950604 RepID=A0ABY4WFD4_9BACL|nr:HPr family phosphocarrier protein [Brevibacillus ruminantium]USG65847.1 HPr family phosphocarrier protein [Brevibacillus ruminantium]
MIQFEVIIKAEGGLHARPAALLVNCVAQSQSKVFLIRKQDQKRVDARSILGIMTLGTVQGDQLLIEIDGPDEAQVSEAIRELFEES